MTQSDSLPESRRAAGRGRQKKLRIAGLVLAAGRSRRMGGENKLLLDIEGEPMVRRVASALRRSRADAIYLVTGYDHHRVEGLFRGFGARLIHNADHAQGLSHSLAAGLRALDADVDGVLVCLGDMPWVTADDIDRLIAAFAARHGRMICVPTYRGRRGNPVLWPRSLFGVMAKLSGDAGARKLLDEYSGSVLRVPVAGPGVLTDCDTRSALNEASGRGVDDSAQD